MSVVTKYALAGALLAKMELGVRDTIDARQREAQIATSKDAPLLNKIITPILALGIVSLTFVLFAFVMFDDAPVDSSRKDILIYILGVLSAIATQIISYYFGSSIEEHAAGAKPSGELVAEFLQYWKDKGVQIQARER